MGNKPQNNEKKLRPIMVKAWSLSQEGLTQEEIGAILDRTAKTIRRYVAKVQNTLYADHDYALARYNIKTLVGPAVKNMQKFVNRKIGTERSWYKASERILEQFKLLTPKKVQAREGQGDTFVNQQYNINQDISIENRVDVEFANELPAEFTRMLGVIKKLQIAEIPGSCDDQESVS